MKKNNLFNFLVFILIFCIVACSPQKDGPESAQKESAQKEAFLKEVVQKATASKEAASGKQLSKEEQEIQAKRLEANKRLFEIAKSGKNKNMTYVRLTSENKFTDTLSGNLLFTRDKTSGPGTGKFIGNGFEFAEGKCEDLNNLSDTDKKLIRWRNRVNKCQSEILENDWCARQKDDPAESYSLTFLSWTISNDECEGACKENDNKTAYIRVKTDNE
jgi:hypothetical protein